jgi:hypothetical protein
VSHQPRSDAPAPWLSIVVPLRNEAGLRPPVRGRTPELFRVGDGLQVLRDGLAERRRDFVEGRAARASRRLARRAERRAVGLAAILPAPRLVLLPGGNAPATLPTGIALTGS